MKGVRLDYPQKSKCPTMHCKNVHKEQVRKFYEVHWNTYDKDAMVS